MVALWWAMAAPNLQSGCKSAAAATIGTLLSALSKSPISASDNRDHRSNRAVSPF
jgi:hypothetical protein